MPRFGLFRRSRRVGLSLLVIGAFVVGTTIGPAAAAAAQAVQQVVITNWPASQHVTVDNVSVPVSIGSTGAVSINNPASSPVPVTGVGAGGTVPVSGSVFVSNNAGAAVPVAVQGTPHVLANTTPATSGGGSVDVDSQVLYTATGVQTAQAIAIHFSAGVFHLEFLLNGVTVAGFRGPNFGGSTDVALSLPRSMQFDSINCFGGPPGTDSCGVSWVGAN